MSRSVNKRQSIDLLSLLVNTILILKFFSNLLSGISCQKQFESIYNSKAFLKTNFLFQVEEGDEVELEIEEDEEAVVAVEVIVEEEEKCKNMYLDILIVLCIWLLRYFSKI